ncbi:hypothetical protein [Polaromonas glacialis]|uniref:hypothetical protein n=1 Tax=Polaromonas glacialis TaxID=866564 RepID=UPI0012EC0BB4|nr:hypothetical protein [Polaromonas glacialis]
MLLVAMVFPCAFKIHMEALIVESRPSGCCGTVHARAVSRKRMHCHGMKPDQARRNGKAVRAVCPPGKAAKHAASLLEPPGKLASNRRHV